MVPRISLRSNDPVQTQENLWDAQHAHRGSDCGLEGGTLRDTPNWAGLALANRLPIPSTILEIGCANGRDARFLAALGHRIIAIDFSKVALSQLSTLAAQQQVLDRITPIKHDISDGTLPLLPGLTIDCFYARSALHVDDQTMLRLATSIDQLLTTNALIIIEGKREEDPKIQSSEIISGNLALNLKEQGHLRRIWTAQFVIDMCRQLSWQIESLQSHNEAGSSYLRLIARRRAPLMVA